MTATPNALAVAAAGAKKCSHWNENDNAYLAKWYGFKPTSELMAHLGRTRRAICHRAALLNLVHPINDDAILNSGPLSTVLGISQPSAIRLLHSGMLPTINIYRGDSVTVAVRRKDLERYVLDSYNWQVIDVDKIQDGRLRILVDNIKELYQTTWLTTRQAAAELHMTVGGVRHHIKSGQLQTVMRSGNFLISRIDVARLKRELQNTKFIQKKHYKLDAAKVRQMRRRVAAGETIMTLAAEYGVAVSSARAAVRGISYRHVAFEPGQEHLRHNNPRPSAKLEKDQVVEIIQLIWDGLSMTDIGRRYGVTASCVSAIALGNTWQEVPRPNRERPDWAYKRGSGLSISKLTEEQVREIRRLFRGRLSTGSEMAKRFGVSSSTIYEITRGATWTHVK